MNAGTLAILNCSTGDTRISFDSADEGEIERAKTIVEDMLRRGYMISVDVGGKMQRATGFDPKAGEYIVENAGPRPVDPPAERPKKRGSYKKTRVPASSARAIAVGQTAGGGIGRPHFPARLDELTREKGIRR